MNLDVAQTFRPSEILRQRAGKRRSQYYCKIDSSVFIGVFFKLLIIFMLIPGSTPPHHGMPVDPAGSLHSRLMPWALREDALRLAIARDGKVYFGSSKVAPEELPGEIRNGLDAGSEKRIYLLVDARARYSDVKPALDQIRLAGVENVSLLTQSAPPQ